MTEGQVNGRVPQPISGGLRLGARTGWARPCPPRHEHLRTVVSPANEERAERRTWIGEDHHGLELEIVAIVLPEQILFIHVMPTALRHE